MEKQDLHQRISLIEETLERVTEQRFLSGMAVIFAGILCSLASLLMVVYAASPYRYITLLWLCTGTVAFGVNVLLIAAENRRHKKQLLSSSKKVLIWQVALHAVCLVALGWVFSPDVSRFIGSVLLVYGFLLNGNRFLLARPMEYFSLVLLVAGCTCFVLDSGAAIAAFLTLGVGHIVVGVVIKHQYGK